MTGFTHIWFWRRVLGERKGQPCKVTARGKMNSVRVEFPDGFTVITSRHAVRMTKPAPPPTVTVREGMPIAEIRRLK